METVVNGRPKFVFDSEHSEHHLFVSAPRARDMLPPLAPGDRVMVSAPISDVEFEGFIARLDRVSPLWSNY